MLSLCRVCPAIFVAPFVASTEIGSASMGQQCAKMQPTISDRGTQVPHVTGREIVCFALAATLWLRMFRPHSRHSQSRTDLGCDTWGVDYEESHTPSRFAIYYTT